MTADDYSAIRNLASRYCDRPDYRDYVGVGALFACAALYVHAARAPIRGVAIVRSLGGQYARLSPDIGAPKTREDTTTLIIAPVGPDVAGVESCAVVSQASDELRLQPLIACTNYDRFARAAGSWRVGNRRIEISRFGELSAHPLPPTAMSR